jgi:hypothetical protein
MVYILFEQSTRSLEFGVANSSNDPETDGDTRSTVIALGLEPPDICVLH